MKLMKYLPWMIYNGEKYVKDYQDALDVQVAATWADLYGFLNQVRLSTCNWGIKNFEAEYEIPEIAEKPLEQRVALVRAKRRRKGTTTVEAVKNITSLFFDGDIEVVEHPYEYWIELKFVNFSGRPPQFKDLMEILNEIIPAHLGLAYSCTRRAPARQYIGVVSHKTIRRMYDLRGANV
jgi:hypothetical protein